MTAQEYAISQHAATNHYYDKYLPYEFHLRMVVQVAKQFIHLIPQYERDNVYDACWMHDLIEDCRCSYNDVLKNSNIPTAEIVRACTNYTRGRNRKERMPDECYHDILTVQNALFVKLCDRIANIQYSKMSGSSMFEMYKKEHHYFAMKLNVARYPEMWVYIQELFS